MVIHGGGGIHPGSIKDGQKDTPQRQARLMFESQTKSIGRKAGSNINETKNVLDSQQASITKKLVEQNNEFAQKVEKKQALMNAITEAIKTQKVGKGDVASAKQLNAMIQELADGDQCQRSAPLTIDGVELVVNPPPDPNQFIAELIYPKCRTLWSSSLLSRFCKSTINLLLGMVSQDLWQFEILKKLR